MSIPIRANIYTDEKTQDFLLFLLEFVVKAKNLKVGYYQSDDKRFTILVKETLKIRDEKDILIDSETPARVNHKTEIIEVAKGQFDKFTSAMRTFILLHEWFHLNLDTKNEFEADLEALRLFLALGFPAQEAINSMTKVFKSKTYENDLRIENLMNYIEFFNK